MGSWDRLALTSAAQKPRFLLSLDGFHPRGQANSGVQKRKRKEMSYHRLLPFPPSFLSTAPSLKIQGFPE